MTDTPTNQHDATSQAAHDKFLLDGVKAQVERYQAAVASADRPNSIKTQGVQAQATIRAIEKTLGTSLEKYRANQNPEVPAEYTPLAAIHGALKMYYETIDKLPETTLKKSAIAATMALRTIARECAIDIDHAQDKPEQEQPSKTGGGFVDKYQTHKSPGSGFHTL